MKSDLDSIGVHRILKLTARFLRRNHVDQIRYLFVEAGIHQFPVVMYNSVFVFAQTAYFQGPAITVHSKIDFSF